ncbi:hypothetical protein Aple_073660 [Acrocarpospora pleiomorpha]|uniref:Uncharacterized protein n=1 Tax=Acrocarpospora pleiomorpha TaxID=90975 RepID=A0A5M3XT42_9ACTN|nr:hypothetical protein [Acrocarpospora pleiomorpha]GES24467.1 hypothetical protein Aple_073660 [Acrocarpospora pleiomorpha]
MTRQGSGERARNTLADLERAFDAAVAGIDAEVDPNRAYEGATELVEAVRRLFEASAELRAHSAARLFKEEQMSLAGLADRIGVSKARAAQLIKTAKSADEKQGAATEEAK